jgi:hypothetical protein
VRAMSIFSSFVALGFVIYASVSFMAISSVINPTTAAKPREKPLPLEKAAPEVITLRPVLRDLALKASDMIPLCPKRDVESEPARPRGKVLVWDVEKHDVSEAHGRVPANLRVLSADEPCTVYLIAERERRAVMNYNYDFFHGGGSAGVQGFRTDLIVCAVDLPSLQPRGWYRINGNGPPQLVTLEPGVREIDEDWAGNLGRWIESCVHGPEARHYAAYQQSDVRCADKAREVLDQCELIGSLSVLPNVPTQVLIWNPQTDRWHESNGGVRNRGDGDKPLLVISVLDNEFVRDGRTGRFDYFVSLVAFPGERPLGIYRVRGDNWPLPIKPGETWGNDKSQSNRNPTLALANWANHFCSGKRGLPPGTIKVAPDAIHLAGTDWLKGPGWTKYVKIGPTAPEYQNWEKMAQECSPKIDECRRKGSPVPSGKLPKKVAVWTDCGDCFLHNWAQEALPKPMQAVPKDKEVLMAILVSSNYEREPKNAPTTEREIYEVALFTMPGAQPIGIYRVVGRPVDANWRATNGGDAPNQKKDLSAWLARFMESPAVVARESAVR